MASHHMPTFLRSAIARDPFCHRGIITPEDVLRLEAKFPSLFDKPSPPPPTLEHEAEKSEEEDDNDTELEGRDPLPVKEKGKVVTGRNPRRTLVKPQQQQKSTHAGNNKVAGEKKKVVQVARNTRPVVVPQRKKPSEFHKNCVETEPPPPTKQLTGQIKKLPPKPTGTTRLKGSGSSKLTRPAQSFSLEDLRQTLRQVMAEDDVQKSKWLRSDKSPSPYTEDLLKKFLGWKMKQEEQKRKVQGSRNVNAGGMKGGQGDAARMKQLTATIAAYLDNPPVIGQGERNRLTQHTAVSSPGKREHKVGIPPRVRSAPGFLRGPLELPPVPNYRRMIGQRGGGDGKPTRKETEDDLNVEKEENLGIADEVKRKKHVRWEEDEEQVGNEQDDKEERLHGDRASRESSQESVRFEKQRRSGMKGTKMHLRSQKRAEDSIYEEQAAVVDERFKMKSSYQDLLAARSDKTRYEVKGFLRKQTNPCNFYTKQLERERAAQKHLRSKHGGYFMEPDQSSSEPSENFTRKMKELGRTSQQETNRALEIMAKELVYLEVLHHVNELKREQEEAEVNDRKQELLKPQRLSESSLSSPRKKGEKIEEIVLPNFVASTTDQDESESSQQKVKSQASSEILLKTPDLTPPSIPGRGKIRQERKEKPSPSKKDLISLHTPELSPSPKRLIAAIKARKELEKKLQQSPPQPQQHLDTDCSEMSDFVFSEASKRIEKSTPAPAKEEESVKLKTPQLSNSLKEEKEGEEGIPPEEKSEKNESTLSEVPSTFPETPSQSQRSSHPGKNAEPENVENSVQNYSDDFTPEKGSVSSAHPLPVQAANTASPLLPQVPQVPQVISDDDLKSEGEPNEQLNTSGETVIDLISEGEFIGPSYRSPGELSWRQQTRNRPPLSGNPSVVGSSTSRPRMAQTLSFEQQESVTDSTVKGTDDESISILSYGAQIGHGGGGDADSAKNVSLGEYL